MLEGCVILVHFLNLSLILKCIDHAFVGFWQNLIPSAHSGIETNGLYMGNTMDIFHIINLKGYLEQVLKYQIFYASLIVHCPL